MNVIICFDVMCANDFCPWIIETYPLMYINNFIFFSFLCVMNYENI